MATVSFNGGAIRITPNQDGSFNVDDVVRLVAMAGVAPVVYTVAEDVLKEAANRANIKTGLLRSTGNVTLEGDNNPLIAMQLANPVGKKRKGVRVYPGSVTIGKREGVNIVAMKALLAMRASGRLSFTFRIGFHTSYARYIHQGDWKRLGARSAQANQAKRKKKVSGVSITVPGRYAGKIGKFYLTRAWTDNMSRYLSFIDKKIGRK